MNTCDVMDELRRQRKGLDFHAVTTKSSEDPVVDARLVSPFRVVLL